MSFTGAVPAPIPASLPVALTPRPSALRVAAPHAPTAPSHRARATRSGWGVAIDVAGRFGTLVTIAAALVVAGAVGGLTDGVTPSGPAAAVGHATLGER